MKFDEKCKQCGHLMEEIYDKETNTENGCLTVYWCSFCGTLAEHYSVDTPDKINWRTTIYS